MVRMLLGVGKVSTGPWGLARVASPLKEFNFSDEMSTVLELLLESQDKTADRD